MGGKHNFHFVYCELLLGYVVMAPKILHDTTNLKYENLVVDFILFKLQGFFRGGGRGCLLLALGFPPLDMLRILFCMKINNIKTQ